jgi:hypothetical protein
MKQFKIKLSKESFQGEDTYNNGEDNSRIEKFFKIFKSEIK